MAAAGDRNKLDLLVLLKFHTSYFLLVAQLLDGVQVTLHGTNTTPWGKPQKWIDTSSTYFRNTGFQGIPRLTLLKGCLL